MRSSVNLLSSLVPSALLEVVTILQYCLDAGAAEEIITAAFSYQLMTKEPKLVL